MGGAADEMVQDSSTGAGVAGELVTEVPEPIAEPEVEENSGVRRRPVGTSTLLSESEEESESEDDSTADPEEETLLEQTLPSGWKRVVVAARLWVPFRNIFNFWPFRDICFRRINQRLFGLDVPTEIQIFTVHCHMWIITIFVAVACAVMFQDDDEDVDLIIDDDIELSPYFPNNTKIKLFTLALCIFASALFGGVLHAHLNCGLLSFV